MALPRCALLVSILAQRCGDETRLLDRSILFIKVNQSTEFWVSRSNGSAVRALNYRQTDGTDFIPSTTDVEGNYEYMYYWIVMRNHFIFVLFLSVKVFVGPPPRPPPHSPNILLVGRF